LVPTMMMTIIGQETSGGFDYLWLLLPLLCCILMFSGQRNKSSPESRIMDESFYTAQGIDESFNKIEKEIDQWRVVVQEKKAEGLASSIVRRLRGDSARERFIEKERSVPRLISLDDISGPIYFEFTEVEGGGTVIKATYSSDLKGRFAKLKSILPLKIPDSPIGLNCPSCGKPVLREFNLCPYCGSKLSK